jgi:hypothetical protein
MSDLSNWARTQILVQNEKHFQKQKYAKLKKKSMDAHRPTNITLDEIGKSEYDRAVAFLSIFILLYLYASDDGIISTKEKRIFRKVFNKNKNLLNKDDYEELIKHTESSLRIQNVLDYIQKNEFSDELVNSSVALIKKYALKDYAYIKTLNDLVKQNQVK